MDPLLLLAEWWWIAPVALGAGAVTVVGMRHRSDTSGRRVAFDAARDDLAEAQRQAGERRRAVKFARAEYARLVAERTAGRTSAAEVAGAKRALQQAERNVKAADAEVRARRVQLRIARAEMPAASQHEHFPVARLNRRHDAITARWMDYETDAAKLIAYPAMSDAKDPATAGFLSASRRAQQARPAPGARITTQQFAEYRDAVSELERAFEVAEHSARARAEGRDPNASTAWQDTAQQVLSRSADALERAAGAAASAFATWNARRQGHSDDSRDADGGPTEPDRPHDSQTQKQAKIWPVPRRDDP